MKKRLLRAFIATLAALAALTSAPAPARASEAGEFRTPSGAIGCGYFDAVLRCDVRGGVIPLPPRPRSCDLDWGQGGAESQRPRGPLRHDVAWRRDHLRIIPERLALHQRRPSRLLHFPRRSVPVLMAFGPTN
jgi:hypothetical protein